MRREGFEFAVSKAEVLYKKDENGKTLEPMELAYIDVPNEFAGAVIEALTMPGFVLLLSGGIAYTIGAVLYGIGAKKHWMHSVFHIFVVLGSVLQFFAVLYAL